MKKLLDSPQWAALTQRQKELMTDVTGNGKPLDIPYPTPAQIRDLETLGKLGLVRMAWLANGRVIVEEKP